MYLITGAAGFIGFHLSLTLLKKQKNVVGIDNINDYYDPKIKYDRLKILKEFPKFKFYKIDLKNKKNIFKEIGKYKNRIHVIVHFAGQAGVRYSIVNPITYIENNIISYVNLLEFFKDSSKVKLLIYASSSSIYGERGSKKAVSSKAQTNPISVYSASKLSMELISNVYNHLYKINIIGVRFFSVYGPWGRPDMAMFLFTDKILKNEKIKVFNNGNMKRDFTYIDDIVSGTKSAIHKNYKCEIFNLGNNKTEELMDVIHLIEEYLNKKARIDYMPIQPGDVKESSANINKTIEMLDYKPTTNIDIGLKNFIDWYIEYKEIL